MNANKLDFVFGFMVGFSFLTLLALLLSDTIKTNAVNEYLSGELKCVPDNFEPEKLVCRSNVGK